MSHPRALLQALLWDRRGLRRGPRRKAAGADRRRFAPPWPVTYANGLGLVAVTGVVLASGSISRVLAGGRGTVRRDRVPPFSRSALLVG